MKTIMAIVEVGVVFLWVMIPLVCIQSIITRSNDGIILINDLVTFEFLVVTCLVGIYTKLEERK